MLPQGRDQLARGCATTTTSQSKTRSLPRDVYPAIVQLGRHTTIWVVLHKFALWNCAVDTDSSRPNNATGPDLRQMRYFVKVAETGSFTAAANELHVAQQAVSQQVQATERMLGVRLLRRAPRAVTPTPAGEVFLREAKRVLNAAERLIERTRAAAQGKVGQLRIAYTMTSAYETFPDLHAALDRALPHLEVQAREVFGGDVPTLLTNGRFDLALAPRSPLPDGLASQPLREEPLLVAISAGHDLATETSINLEELQDELFELWPRDMAPGYYDAAVAACRAAGFEAHLDATAAGSIVWGNIARGRGVGLIVGSLTSQVPHGVRILPICAPHLAPLSIDIVWPVDPIAPAVEQFRNLARDVANRHGWLPTARRLRSD
jgi:DNA-binding transcriptional LysR family regulator